MLEIIKLRLAYSPDLSGRICKQPWDCVCMGVAGSLYPEDVLVAWCLFLWSRFVSHYTVVRLHVTP